MPWQVVHRCSLVFFESFVFFCAEISRFFSLQGQIKSSPRTGNDRSETFGFSSSAASSSPAPVPNQRHTVNTVLKTEESGDDAAPGWLKQSDRALRHAACNRSVSSSYLCYCPGSVCRAATFPSSDIGWVVRGGAQREGDDGRRRSLR